jgi:uncharacterized protein YdhG (YjbR/CyaY superfamily)
MMKAVKIRADSAAQLRAYMAAQPVRARRALATIRRAIRETVPEAAETVSYGIPAFRLGDRVLIYFAGWKHHTSLYPIGPRLAEACGAKGYTTSKGTIQFPLEKPVPVALVKRLVKARIAALRSERKR